MRKRNIYKSAIMGLLEECVSIVCGFILPRMILTYFGSNYNGIVAAVTQFIGCIALLKSGIGMATKAALYEPLYHHDKEKIDGIMSATMKFLRKIALIFCMGILAFAGVYPLVINNEFSWLFSFTLVLIISLGTFFQYFFGLGNQLLLEADQRYYIVSFIAIINTSFSTLIATICIKAGLTIHGVKFYSSIIYCTTPIALYVYVNKTYHLNRKAKPDMESISKRWDAFAMQLANFVNNNTDIIVATIFLNLKEVSVYTIYYLVINGIKKVINRISVGAEAALGNIIAEGDHNRLVNSFLIFEYILNFVCIIAFSCLITLIVPFVEIYTRGVTDVNYSRYTFAVVACAAELFFCLRLSYTFVVQAKGAFAETKVYSYIEAIINIVLSIILVNIYGLVGIVIGTLIAMFFRTIMFALYSARNILMVSCFRLIGRIAVTIVNICINCGVSFFFIKFFLHKSYLQLIMIAIPIGLVSLAITLFFNYIFFKNLTKSSILLVFGKYKKRS